MISENFVNNTKFIIFDMDGVLINSEPVTFAAAAAALAEIGITAGKRDFEPYIGAGEEKFITEPCRLHKKEHMADAALRRLYEIYDGQVSEKLTVYPAVHGTLRALRRAGFILAVASSSARRKLAASLKAAEIPEDWFALIVSGSDVAEKKPSPEIYLKTMEMLNAAPSECLVVEDALTGICAAKRAGARCFAVPTSFDRARLAEAGADTVGESLAQLLSFLGICAEGQEGDFLA